MWTTYGACVLQSHTYDMTVCCSSRSTVHVCYKVIRTTWRYAAIVVASVRADAIVAPGFFSWTLWVATEVDCIGATFAGELVVGVGGLYRPSHTRVAFIGAVPPSQVFSTLRVVVHAFTTYKHANTKWCTSANMWHQVHMGLGKEVRQMEQASRNQQVSTGTPPKYKACNYYS